MSMSIKLKDIWPIENVGDYKVHFARYNGVNEPLDEWLEDPDNWVYWQAHRPQRNEFSREFIFSLMKFYSEEDVWLFGGIFRVLADHGHGNEYEVELTDHGEDFIGRLKIFRDYRSMSSRVNLENHYDEFEVSEILREPYSGRIFPGYENIDLPFKELATLLEGSSVDAGQVRPQSELIVLVSNISISTQKAQAVFRRLGLSLYMAFPIPK